MKIFVHLSTLLLAACVSTPQPYWHRIDTGQRVDETPAVLAQFQRDRVICDGEAAKAALASNEKVVSVHRKNINLVFDGCLAERGYIRR